LSYARVRATIHQVLPIAGGADPLLGFHLREVFTSPVMTVPNAQSPLTHFNDRAAEADLSFVPQSLNEQENWLVSLETAYPFEIFVLIFSAPDGPILERRPDWQVQPHSTQRTRFGSSRRSEDPKLGPSHDRIVKSLAATLPTKLELRPGRSPDVAKCRTR
jgi:hypothetical protein